MSAYLGDEWGQATCAPPQAIDVTAQFTARPLGYYECSQAQTISLDPPTREAWLRHQETIKALHRLCRDAPRPAKRRCRVKAWGEPA